MHDFMGARSDYAFMLPEYLIMNFALQLVGTSVRARRIGVRGGHEHAAARICEGKKIALPEMLG